MELSPDNSLTFKTFHELLFHPSLRAGKVITISWGDCLIFHHYTCCSLCSEYTFPPISAQRLSLFFFFIEPNQVLLSSFKSPPHPSSHRPLLLHLPHLIIVICEFSVVVASTML